MKLNVRQTLILQKIEDKELRKAFKKQWKQERKLDAKREVLMVKSGIKPPLGLKPKFVHDEERIAEINEAIDRFRVSGKEIPSEWIEEKFQLEKSIILYKTHNSETPKEFCVEITEENIDVLSSLFKDKKIDLFASLIKKGNYVISTKCGSLLRNTEPYLDILGFGKQELPIVSTEEFLRYIGKEELIRSISKVIPENLSENPITPDKCFKDVYSDKEPDISNKKANSNEFNLKELSEKASEMIVETYNPDGIDIEFDFLKQNHLYWIYNSHYMIKFKEIIDTYKKSPK